MTNRVMMRVLLLFLIIELLSVRSWAQNASVLAEGNWYKFAVTEDGLYRLSGSELAALGVDVSSVSSATIQVFGQGGGMLPQSLAEPRSNDLPEVAIWVEDGDDDRLDADDYLLFYGQSPHNLHFASDDELGHRPTYQKNLYSDTAYYFLTLGSNLGKRVQSAAGVDNPAWTTDYYQDALVHEEELYNLLQTYWQGGSGREWLGEELTTGESREVSLPAVTWRSEQSLRVHTRVVGRSESSAEVQISVNGNAIGEISLDPVLSGTYTQKGKISQASFSANADQSGDATVTLSLSGNQARANLDQLILEGARALTIPADKPVRFRNLESTSYPTTQFRLSADQTPVVWDVSNPQEPTLLTVNATNSQWAFATVTRDILKEFVAGTSTGFLSPTFSGTVANQNLKGGDVPNLVIVTREDLVPEAQRLADFRRTFNQISVQVVTNQQIYNEFSSGTPDVTALRNYLKYLYDRQPDQLQAVLLFGKGSYDYKEYTENNTNIVPIYQSRNSVHPIYSYASDDYFGFLEDDEGEWVESFAGDHTLDIGVGRLPVKNATEATSVVDKLIHYQTSEATFGQWRNQLVFVADDGDNDKHQRDAERLAQFVDTAYVSFSIRKIYTDAFEQLQLPGREEAPEVSREIEDAIKQGALIMNYTGHGSETRWAQESILTTGMINRFRNYDRLPFFVTATCEFGRHDSPQEISGAEKLILSEEGGAIGLVTTSRPVFSNSNFLLNRAFYDEVFRREGGQPLTLGEIFRRTKNNGLNGPVNRNFSLLGDPSMVLAYPQARVSIEQLAVRQANEQFIVTDTLRALDYVQLTGTVVSPATQQVLINFSGTVEVEVLDKSTLRRTQGNEGTFMQFEERNSVIHRGKARVVDGQFMLNFVVPKNIVYQTGQGKITAYASSARAEEGGDAHGASVDFIIGGSQRSTVEDAVAPAITLFMDDTTFVDGGLTGTNSLLLAQLNDEHGISISSSGLGQTITAELFYEETEESRTFVLNDFYQADVDNFQSGWIRYPMDGLEEGKYRLTLQAWDTYNNSGEAELSFWVGEEGTFWVTNVYNYPNPFSEETRFVLDHNQPGTILDVTIQIYNNQGELVHQMQTTQPEVTTRLADLYWDGRTTAGAHLPSGVYYANIRIRSTQSNTVEQKTHQLIIAH
ncbi:type IX secretion system sortase PorU [Tunicatimonas pelagia]|uniref:type IX secretion system sortase PorU n=1 Tax=Tunicatimonas pelagia TaxID=931531 RepID=UPI0026665283|nr:type IX secretion system sortase PorU [Tunicatimonas pelagia]WKN43973.1 type IX secretion system sortase PorU [Tunicatimonas pelagia]